MSTSKAIFLDVDSSIVENNLRIGDDDFEDEFHKFFGNKTPDYPTKLVKPHPGLCIKAKEQNTDTKVFINICTTDAIPPPKDITEAELEEILESDSPSEYKLPMSIGDVKPEKDSRGNEAKAVDIAINPSFLERIKANKSFQNFFMSVIFQSIGHKHGIFCGESAIILANKKAYGTLQTHCIQQREIYEKMGKQQANRFSITELTEEKGESKKVVIETISSVENANRQPEYRLYKKKGGPNCLIGEFKFPDLISSADITLDVGEDRIVLESKSKGYLLDIFVPYCIRSEKCTSTFNKALKILTIVMPLIGG